jgi:hypothetical protein
VLDVEKQEAVMIMRLEKQTNKINRRLLFTMIAVFGLGTCTSELSAEPLAMTPRPATIQLAQSRIVDPACFCWANGERYNRGEIACLRTGNGRVMAECDQFTNVMSWNFTRNPCPES